MKSLRELMCNCRRLNWWRTLYQRKRLQPDELLTLLILMLIALLLLNGCTTMDCQPEFTPNPQLLQTLFSNPNTLINHPAGMVDCVSFSCRAAF